MSRDLLIDQVEQNGWPEQRARAFVRQLSAETAADISAMSDADIAQIVDLLDAELEHLHEIETYAVKIDHAAKIVDAGVVTHADGSALSLLNVVASALPLLLLSPKLRSTVKIDLSWLKLTATLEAGLPSEVRRVLRALARRLEQMADKPNDANPPDDLGDAPGNVEAESEDPPSSTVVPEQDGSEDDTTENAPMTSMPALKTNGLILPVADWPKGPLSLSVAVTARDRLFTILNAHIDDIRAGLERQFPTNGANELWPESQFSKQERGLTWRRGQCEQRFNWPFREPFRFGVGLYSAGANSGQYRLAIRIQSPHEMKQRVVKWLDARLHDVNANFSLRWSAPLVTLAANPQGNFKPWAHKPVRSGKATIGAPINIAGGRVGTFSLFMKESDKFLGVTAGHIIWDDDGRGEVKDQRSPFRVYSEPQSDTPEPGAMIGTVRHVSPFPPLRLGHPPQPGSDVAIIALEDDAVPVATQRALMNGRSFRRSFFDLPDLPPGVMTHEPAIDGLISGKKVEKSTGKTGMATGNINLIGVTIEIIDTATGYPIVGTNLVEVVMAPDAKIELGDSGSLLCVNEDNQLTPLGFICAGQRIGRIYNTDGKSTSSVYSQPFSTIASLKQLEIG